MATLRLHEPKGSPAVPEYSLKIAWLVGLGLSVLGLFDGIAEWPFAYSLATFLWLAFVPVFWVWRTGRSAITVAKANSLLSHSLLSQNLIAAALAGLSLSISLITARIIGDLPPAYHDEYSYLFQAKTFLAGRTWVPSHPTHPELFDQMHVLNDSGRMASRYFPGTGLWLMPFVAISHPWWGHWLCNALATVFVYAAGCEVRNRRTGILTGGLTALSPGLALFGNLLLAHQPTLLGLSLFLWMMIRFRNSPDRISAAIAACGLAGAMLCRPMTAAAFGLPFGIWLFAWFWRGQSSSALRLKVFLIFSVVIGSGLVGQMVYDASITGSPFKSPYQLYNEIYTPRHIYGFNNVSRGERLIGPKNLTAYDQWAENLTPALAAQNVFIRVINGWQLIWDALPLAMLSVIFLLTFRRWEVPLQLCAASIVSLHVAHIPYWYVGIMGWHYVFESLILWTFVAGAVGDTLLAQWKSAGYDYRPIWLTGFVLLTLSANLISIPGTWTAKLARGASMLRYSRDKHAKFLRGVEEATAGRPALVLVGPHRDDGQLDYVVNDPGLNGPLLLGRYRPGKTDLHVILRDFPERDVWISEPDRQLLRRLSR